MVFPPATMLAPATCFPAATRQGTTSPPFWYPFSPPPTSRHRTDQWRSVHCIQAPVQSGQERRAASCRISRSLELAKPGYGDGRKHIPERQPLTRCSWSGLATGTTGGAARSMLQLMGRRWCNPVLVARCLLRSSMDRPTLPIDQIEVGFRYRKDLGDLRALADSIA